MTLSRRAALGVLGGALGLAGHADLLLGQGHGEPEAPASARDALVRLLEGNARFAAGHSAHPREAAWWRSRLKAAQHPFAIVIGCADSRVPPELLFDQGFGDLFTVRVAGQAIDESVLGSVQYASLHLRTPLCIVLGHQGCGAVRAALAARRGAHEPARIDALLGHLTPAIDGLPREEGDDALMPRAVRANVRWSVRQLMDAGALGRIGAVGTALVGAVYDLETGKVTLV